MSHKNLEELLRANGGAVNHLRNSPSGPNPYPVVPPEYTNWRDEQHAWQHAAILFNQSYHMSDLYVSGPDAFKLLEALGTNSFKGFSVNKAKQYAPVNWDGYVIGDVILFYLDKDLFNLVGRPPVLNWVQYHGTTGGYDGKFERDERSAARVNPTARKTYRAIFDEVLKLWQTDGVLGISDPARWETAARFMQEMGLITTAVKPETLYTNQFVETK